MFSIIALGDSITFGKGAGPGKGWADRLRAFFEPRDPNNALYNLGIPGNSSTDLLERAGKELEARVRYVYPEDRFVILIAIGTNDSRGMGIPENIQTKPEKYRENIERVVDLAKDHTKHVVLIGLPPVDESLMPFEDTYFNNLNIEKFNGILEAVAKNKGVQYCKIYEEFFRKDHRKLLADGLHPNNEGHELIYERIRDFLKGKGLI